MPTITTTTWPCGCVVELEVENGNDKFLMLSRVCTKHKPLTSTEKRPNHSQLATHVMDLIEEAKAANILNYQEALLRCETNWDRKEVISLLPIVERKNTEITEKYGEFITFTYAFDSHILEQIRYG